MRSLRVKVLVTIAVVVVSTLVFAGLFSSHVTRVELRRSQDIAAPVASAEVDEDFATAVEAHYRREGWEGIDAAVGDSVSPHRAVWVVVDDDGRVVHASDSAYAVASYSVDDAGHLSIVRDRREGHRTTRLNVVVRTGYPLADTDGVKVGTLYPLPDGTHAEVRADVDVVAAVNRRLLMVTVLAGLVGVLAAAVLSQRIVSPLAALTGAARKYGLGDLSERVDIRSRDEIGELGAAFNTMADALQRTEGLRRRLVSDVAHELRTPLTNLQGQIEALQDGLRPVTAESLQSLHDESRLLARLTDDLQDLALAEADALRLERDEIDLGAEVRRAVESFTGGNGQHPAIRLDEPPSLVVVSADPRRVGQVVRNLIHNALRHTPAEGEIRVRVRRAENAAEVVVADTGTGIAAQHLPFIFERFYRTDPSRSRDTGSAGLGLAIVKQLVEAHGGRVWAESELGRGTKVTFSLPA